MLKKIEKKKIIKFFFFKKKLQIPLNLQFSIYNYNLINYLIISINTNFNKYFKIPFLIEINKKNSILELILFNSINHKIFYYSLVILFKNLNNVFYKKLILQGLGYKVLFYSKLNYLEFKLGFSHKKVLSLINKNIQVYLLKNMVILTGNNSTILGNFAVQIKNLRKIDKYKGKGFWYLNENPKLKIIKKV